MRTLTATAALALLALAACGPTPPVVSSFNESSVEIQQDNTFGGASASDPAVIAEATRICGTAGRRAEYASTRMVQTGEYTVSAAHLFLCLRS